MFTLLSIIFSFILSLGLAASLQARVESVEIGNVEEVHLALYGTVWAANRNGSILTTASSPMN